MSKHTKAGRKVRRRRHHEGIAWDAMEREGMTRFGLPERLRLDGEEPTAFADTPNERAGVASW